MIVYTRWGREQHGKGWSLLRSFASQSDVLAMDEGRKENKLPYTPQNLTYKYETRQLV